jgi:hypothetical protein
MALQSFSSGQTLTAQQMMDLQKNDYNQTVSAKTTSYSAVVGDVGTHIQMTASTATTLTFGTGIFAAGDSLFVSSQGAGVCTLTAGSNFTLSSSGSKALSQYSGGVVRFESSSAATFYASDVAASSSGLVCVKAETAFTTASTINVNNVFSSTYTNYLLNIIFDASTELDVQLRLRVGGVDNSTANSYKRQTIEASGGSSTVTQTQRDNYLLGAGNASAPSAIQAYLFQPFSAAKTPIMSNNQRSSNTTTIFISWAYHDQTVSYDGFSLLTSTGTITGTYSVYGYSKTV